MKSSSKCCQLSLWIYVNFVVFICFFLLKMIRENDHLSSCCRFKRNDLVLKALSTFGNCSHVLNRTLFCPKVHVWFVFWWYSWFQLQNFVDSGYRSISLNTR